MCFSLCWVVSNVDRDSIYCVASVGGNSAKSIVVVVVTVIVPCLCRCHSFAMDLYLLLTNNSNGVLQRYKWNVYNVLGVLWNFSVNFVVEWNSMNCTNIDCIVWASVNGWTGERTKFFSYQFKSFTIFSQHLSLAYCLPSTEIFPVSKTHYVRVLEIYTFVSNDDENLNQSSVCCVSKTKSTVKRLWTVLIEV